MLRTVIISPDTELAAYLHRVLADIGGVSLIRIIDRYPNEIDLTRMLRSQAPQAVFVGVDFAENATGIAAHIERVMPGVQVVAFGRSCEPATLMEIMRAGVREYLAPPFERKCVADCLQRLNDNLAKRPIRTQATDLLYSFLPSKPGAGATTLAINSCIALSKSAEARGLLMDFDLNCGMIRFMLKLESSYSILDATEHAPEMDENLWPQIVTRCGELDVVHAGALNPDIRIQSFQVQHLLDYARRNYKVVCADLSGNLEKYSMEIMHESKRVFLVCTPEISSLHLAREKLQYLQRMDLGNRVSVLLNRYVKRSSITPAEVEQIVGAPVEMAFPNDYARVARAIQEGKGIDQGSELGRSCAELGAHMLERKDLPASPSRRRFVEYFNISPARFSLERPRML